MESAGPPERRADTPVLRPDEPALTAKRSKVFRLPFGASQARELPAFSRRVASWYAYSPQDATQADDAEGS